MKMIPRVVDLSHYDDVQDNFNGAKDFGIWGCINKVTEGVGYHDKSFDWRRQPCAGRGILYGAYHFLRPGRIKEQADFFLSSVGNDRALLLALDHEDAKVPLSDAQLWIKIVQDRTGMQVVLYSGFLIKQQVKNADIAFWQKVPLWLSHYNANPTWPKQIWKDPFLIQYTGDGVGPMPHNVPGIVIHGGKGIDINHYGGTHEQFVKDWSK